MNDGTIRQEPGFKTVYLEVASRREEVQINYRGSNGDGKPLIIGAPGWVAEGMTYPLIDGNSRRTVRLHGGPGSFFVEFV